MSSDTFQRPLSKQTSWSTNTQVPNSSRDYKSVQNRYYNTLKYPLKPIDTNPFGCAPTMPKDYKYMAYFAVFMLALTGSLALHLGVTW
jgi:hypothetical protein